MHTHRGSFPSRPLLAAACGIALLALLGAAKPEERVTQPRLEDWIAEPGSSQRFQPFMLHADQWFGLDQRVKLDTIVFVLENGGRICQVLDRDSTWAADYTWVYPHNLLPPRWYDARALFHAGDSLELADDADLKLTFGTMRLGLKAGSLREATAEAYRRWPAEMPPSLRGRLQLKLDRAKKAIEAEGAGNEPGEAKPKPGGAKRKK